MASDGETHLCRVLGEKPSVAEALALFLWLTTGCTNLQLRIYHAALLKNGLEGCLHYEWHVFACLSVYKALWERYCVEPKTKTTIGRIMGLA